MHQLEMYLLKKLTSLRKMGNNVCKLIYGKPRCNKKGEKPPKISILFSRNYAGLKIYHEFVLL